LLHPTHRAATYPLSLHDALPIFPVGYSWRVALQQGPLPLRQLRPIVRETVNQGKNFLSGQSTGRSVKVFYLPSQAADPLAGFEEIGRHTSELQSPDHLVCRLLLE